MKNDKKLEPPYIPETSIRNVKEMAANACEKFLDCIRNLESKPDLEENTDRSKDSFEWASFGELIELDDADVDEI